ncbi:MAG: GTPase HflX [Nitrososphaerota archaeon]|nr:GTPase HflX [Candidatus Bathyarchaeota archaeon]MDW8048920.1 GTPase HflX [Nitrososphaerota archaeon]
MIRRDHNEKSNIEELKSLAEAAGYEIVDVIEQVRPQDPTYNIGAGKARELADIVSRLNVQKVIFGNELKIVQIYNLAKLTRVEVIDRFQLILEIFSRRASTKEAKLQIELARLQYELAHAKEKVRLAKAGEQPGFHGLGKYDADIYYETVRREAQRLQAKIRNIRKTREIHRRRRRKLGFSLVSLAGYTNSGKSTLFNALTEENVPADPRLFTTLSTTTRILNLSGERILLTDTVGFIDGLPLTLIEAFHSTLEETIYSDLILLVLDFSEEISEIERKLSCCLNTLQDIGATGVPVLLVLNKIDLLSSDQLNEKVRVLDGKLSEFVPISALHRVNIDLLKDEIIKRLGRTNLHFTLPKSEEALSLLSWIYKNSHVQCVDYKEDSIIVSSFSPLSSVDIIREKVEKVGGAFQG